MQSVNTSNVSFTGQQFDGADYAEVHSTVLLKDQPPPIKVDYLVRRDGASWKIYDLDIDAISVMANYRQQFNRVLNNDGYPALVSMLQKKVKELGSTLDISKRLPARTQGRAMPRAQPLNCLQSWRQASSSAPALYGM